MGVLNITDQVGGKRALRLGAVAQSICWDRAALVRNILRSNLQRRALRLQIQTRTCREVGIREGMLRLGRFGHALRSPGGTDVVLGSGLGSGTGPARLSVAARLADVSCAIRPR